MYGHSEILKIKKKKPFFKALETYDSLQLVSLQSPFEAIFKTTSLKELSRGVVYFQLGLKLYLIKNSKNTEVTLGPTELGWGGGIAGVIFFPNLSLKTKSLLQNKCFIICVTKYIAVFCRDSSHAHPLSLLISAQEVFIKVLGFWLGI